MPHSVLMLYILTHVPILPSSLLGTMSVMSQLICEMAGDRLLFWDLAQIHASTGTPVMAITASGFLAGK